MSFNSKVVKPPNKGEKITIPIHPRDINPELLNNAQPVDEPMNDIEAIKKNPNKIY